MQYKAISLLKTGEDTFVVSSGMGAIFSTIFALTDTGSHVLCNRKIYGETYEIMTEMKSHNKTRFFVTCYPTAETTYH